MPGNIPSDIGQSFSDRGFLHDTLYRSTIADTAHQLSNGVVMQPRGRGVLQFTPPTASTRALLLSAGIHGNETAPIEWLDTLTNDVLEERLVPSCHLLVVFANVPAIRAQQRFMNENLNRLFGDDATYSSNADIRAHDGADYEPQRAAELRRVAHEFFAASFKEAVHYDLHTAIRGSQYEKFAVSPNASSNPLLAEQFNLLGDMEIQAVLNGARNGRTFSAFTARECNTCSFTLELGQVKPFGDNDLSRLAAFNQTVRQTISRAAAEMDGRSNTTSAFARGNAVPKMFQVSREIIKHSAHFSLSFADDTPNFTAFEKNSELAQDGEHRYHAMHDDERIVFPNADVAIGQRALLMVTELQQPTRSISNSSETQ